jgi:hypothetical protein
MPTTKHRRTHTARPALEQLEGRLTPSIAGAVSSVNDNMGNSMTLDVHQNGTLWSNFNGGQFIQVQSEGNDVKSVSAGMDISGQADAFVVHNDGRLMQLTAKTINGSLTLQTMQLANNVKSVVAEGNGTALVIDNQNFLWQYNIDLNQKWDLPVDMNMNERFQGQTSAAQALQINGSLPMGASFSLLDANVSQATLLKDAEVGNDKVIALHTDGTLTSDLAPTQNSDGTLQITPIAQGIASISSVIARGNQFANNLYTVDTNGDLKQNELFGSFLMTVQDFGNANGAGFKDVNVGWNSGDWVATTNTNQVYRDGQLIDSGVVSAFAGPGGTFYEVKTDGTLSQWSAQQHWEYGWWLVPTNLEPWGGSGGVIVKEGWYLTNFTSVDSNVSLN